MNTERFTLPTLNLKNESKKVFTQKKIFVLLLILLLCCFNLIACYKIKYSYAGKWYDDSSSAFDAQKNFQETLLNSIPKTSTPVGRSAYVIMPSTAYIENYFLKFDKEKLKDNSDYGIKLRESYKFTTTIISNEIKAFGYAVEKRGIFDKITYAYSDDPEHFSFQDDIALIYFKGNDGKDRWYVKRKKDSPLQLIPVEEISTTLPPMQRTIMRLNSIEKIARE